MTKPNNVSNGMESGVVPVITLDGPAGSGKGAVSQRLALALGWRYLDSGALYRAATVLAERHGLIVNGEGIGEGKKQDERARRLAALMRDAAFHCEAQATGWARIVLNGEDLSELVREERISRLAARVSKSPVVRAALLRLQHAQRHAPGLVAEGRDMGSVVFADAVASFFLTASVEVRAQRRHKQLSAKGFDVNIAALVQDLEERDHSDRTRAVSPLVPAPGARVLDTSLLTIEEATASVLSRCRELPGL